jgi:hypothetical protein
VLLLVVPVEAVPLVALGTWPGRAGTEPDRVGTWAGSAGTCPDSVGTPPVTLGTCPGSAGTDGTLGVAPTPPAPVLVEPTGGVMTTVESPSPAAPRARRGGGPSGNTHVISRFEQKSGIAVRSVASAAWAVNPTGAENAPSTITARTAVWTTLEEPLMVCLRISLVCWSAPANGRPRPREAPQISQCQYRILAWIKLRPSGTPVEALGPAAFRV